MNGTILGIYNKKVLIQPNESKPNRNIMVVGGPGSYKTQSFVITNVLYETENSIVITDPKAEVYEKTAAIKEAQGYEVHVINFMNMQASDRHNPLDYVRKETQATTVATKMVDSANKDGKRDVWYYSQRALLKALILYAIHELEPKHRNMRGLLEFLQTFDTEDGHGDSDLDKQFLQLDFKHPARRAYELGYKKAKQEMQGSIIVSLLTTISDYIDSEVAEFTSFSDFHLMDIGQKKMMLYVIIPLMDQSWQSLVNLFFSQLFNELYELAALHHAKLPRNVNFILDEFVNLGKFDNYEEFLATCRGYGISVATIIQTISQLQDRYGDKKAESILGNCGIKLCLNAANRTTATYFKDLLDKTTVKVDTESESKQYGKENRTSSMSENESFAARDLMTAGEIMQMPADMGIILFQHKPPIQVKKAFQFQLFPGITEKYEVSQFGYHAKPSAEQLQKLTLAQQAFEEDIAKKAVAKQTEQEQLEKDFFGFEVVEQEVTFESAMEELQGEIDLEKQ